MGMLHLACIIKEHMSPLPAVFLVLQLPPCSYGAVHYPTRYLALLSPEQGSSRMHLMRVVSCSPEQFYQTYPRYFDWKQQQQQH